MYIILIVILGILLFLITFWWDKQLTEAHFTEKEWSVFGKWRKIVYGFLLITGVVASWFPKNLVTPSQIRVFAVICLVITYILGVYVDKKTSEVK